MQATNEQLQNELETLDIQVKQNSDFIESKEKNDKYEAEKKKRETPFKQQLKLKKKELNNLVKANDEIKNKKEDLQRKLEQNVDIEKINNLNDEIRIATDKYNDLLKEKKYLAEIGEKHKKCLEEKEKIEKEILNLQNNLKTIREQNFKKSKDDRDKISKMITSGNITKLYQDLNDEQKKEKKEKLIKEKIDKFWKRNEKNLNNSNKEKIDKPQEKNEKNLNNSNNQNNSNNPNN